MKKLFVAIIFVLIGFTSCTSSNKCKDCKNESNFIQRYKEAEQLKENTIREFEMMKAMKDSLEVTPINF